MFCLHVNVYTVCAMCLSGEGTRSTGTGGPLQEPRVFLTTEPSLQPPGFLNKITVLWNLLHESLLKLFSSCHHMAWETLAVLCPQEFLHSLSSPPVLRGRDIWSLPLCYHGTTSDYVEILIPSSWSHISNQSLNPVDSPFVFLSSLPAFSPGSYLYYALTVVTVTSQSSCVVIVSLDLVSRPRCLRNGTTLSCFISHCFCLQISSLPNYPGIPDVIL